MALVEEAQRCRRRRNLLRAAGQLFLRQRDAFGQHELMGLRPVLTRNRRAKWKRLMQAALAMSARVIVSPMWRSM